MRALLRIVTFVVVGPPVGLLAYLLGTALYDIVRAGRFSDLPEVVRMLVSPEIVGISYVVGGGPALLAGVVGAVLVRFLAPGWRYRLWVMLAAAIASAIGTMWITSGAPAGGNWLPVISFGVQMALTGAAAALASTLVFEGLSRLGRRA
jgi:hypothetical protein